MDTIVVVSSGKKEVNLICKEIKKVDPEINVEVVSSLDDLNKREDKKYKGFLIDFRSMFGCSPNHKIISSVVEENFPVAKFKVNKDNSIGMICSSTVSEDLGSFLKEQVKSFGARRVRRHERVKEKITVSYSTDAGATWEETSTLDVSMGGVFILLNDPLLEGEDVLLKFSNGEVKNAVVRWSRSSKSTKPPGSGLEFL